MPQMAPILWNNIFVLIFLLTMFLTTKLFFSNNKTKYFILNKKVNNNLQYKWMW